MDAYDADASSEDSDAEFLNPSSYHNLQPQSKTIKELKTKQRGAIPTGCAFI